MAASPIPPFISVVSAINQNGKIEIFTIAQDQAIYHMLQAVESGGWTDQFLKLGQGNYALQLTVIQNDSGTLEVFYIGTNQDIYHNWQHHPGSDWNGEVELGNNADKPYQIAIGKNDNGQLQLFCCGSDGSLFYYTRNLDGSWQGKKLFADFFNISALQVAVALDASARLQLCYVDDNYNLFSKYQLEPNAPDSWGGRVQIGGPARYLAMGLLPNFQGLLCVYNDLEGGLFYVELPNGSNIWNEPQPLAARAVKQIAMAINSNGLFELFYTAFDDSLWRMTPTGPTSWGVPQPMGGFGISLSPIPNADKHLELIYVGTNNVLYHNWQLGTSDNWNGEVAF